MKKICGVMSLLIAVLFVGQGYAGEPLQPMTIQLNWIPNVQFAGVLLAKERGWYEKAGIDLTIKGWEEGIVIVDEVYLENAHIGIIDGIEVIMARIKGKKIKAVAADFQKTPFCLLSKKEKGIEQPQHLLGKRIGIDSPGTELMVKIVLANQGLQFEKITPVPVGWNLAPLLDDEVDVYPAYMNDQPLFLREQGYDVTYIPAFKYGYNFYSGVYFVTEATLKAQPELIRKFLDVTFRAWQEAFLDMEATAKLVVEKYSPEESVHQQAASLKIFYTLATMGVGEKLIGFMGGRRWEEGIEILLKHQQIDREIPPSDVYTLELLGK